MNKSFKILNIITMIAILVGDICYIITDNIYIKSITSLLFVALGVINLIYAKKNWCKK